MSAPLSHYAARVKRLLTDLEYRFEPPAPHDANYWDLLHQWTLYTLWPTSSCSEKRLAEMEHAAGHMGKRAYPYASTELQLLFAKITALAILIDDSMEDEATCAELAQFSHKLFLGEPQENRMLALYHATLKEMSYVYEGNDVLRDMAVVPWIAFIDGCLMEKQMFISQHEAPNATYLDGLPPNFPRYMRIKAGASESYIAMIFKATKDQNVPVSKYIKAVPDAVFICDVMNDILSFYKEELAGETCNFIHLRTRSLSSDGKSGSGVTGEWTVDDTFQLLCQEVLEATRRVDGILRLEECERKMRGEIVPEASDGIDELDVEIAKQWRGWRDGYITWHLECRRYKLDFLMGSGA
ncbi:isoprenoid synthase domain-containing protein [Mycena pura]|uniref:Isoprenoid synthase domain-containing protein n=1 Tax=Mycena pura TaxID=153505 RepID=A0AAD6YWE3_9AGAR|nr:isoprenoid synthase domain-containing protein [Mycena pura]